MGRVLGKYLDSIKLYHKPLTAIPLETECAQLGVSVQQHQFFEVSAGSFAKRLVPLDRPQVGPSICRRDC